VSGLRRKNSLTSLDVAVLVEELNQVLGGGRIDNIYASATGALLFKVRDREGSLIYLLVEEGRRIHLTRFIAKGELRGRIPLFRRFLRDGQVQGVRQFRFERIAEFSIRKGGSSLTLVTELMPRGVAVVVDSSGKVLVSSKDLHLKDRVVRPGITYEHPPTFPDPRELGVEEWLSRLGSGGSLGRALVRSLGIPPEVVNESLPEDMRRLPVEGLDTDTVRQVREKVLGFIATVLRNPSPVVVLCGEDPIGFYPFRPSIIPGCCEVKNFQSMNEAVDEFFSSLLRKSGAGSGEVVEEGRARRTLEKALRNLASSREALKRSVKELELFERNYAVLEDVWRCVRRTVKDEGWGKVPEACGVEAYDPSKGVFSIKAGDSLITLTVKSSVKEQYFELRRRVASLRKKIVRAEEAVKELEARLREAEEARRREEERKALVMRREWYSQYHWIRTSSGFIAVGGKDAQQNEKVVRKYLTPKDIFIHADVRGASVFVVKCGGSLPPEEDLREVGTLAASYSRAWREGVGALDAYWVWGEQVSKSPPPGQFLPTGSFMVYGRKNFLRGLRLELSIALRIAGDSTYEVVIGPPHYVKGLEGVKAYVTIVPGDRSRASVAKEFINLVSGLPYRFIGLSPDELMARIPGESRVIDRFVAAD